MMNKIKCMILEADEMSTDLACRNPIHDALDQDRLRDFRRPLETMMEFVGKTKNTSPVSREILTGLMHRVLADEQNNLVAFYSHFLMDNHEDRECFSKFAVNFSDNQFNRLSESEKQLSYYSNVTHLDPE